MKRMKWEAPKLTVLTSPPQAHGKCKLGSAEYGGSCKGGGTAGDQCVYGGGASSKCKNGSNVVARCTAGQTR